MLPPLETHASRALLGADLASLYEDGEPARWIGGHVDLLVGGQA